MNELDESIACENCVRRAEAPKRKPNAKLLNGLEKVGEETIPGMSYTYYTDWKCIECGQEWTEIRDDALGGRDHFVIPGRVR